MVDRVPMPARVARLPRSEVGYPIPWFVADLPDGTRDFRVASADKQVLATRERLCWVCGGALGVFVAFTIGPMCAVNRLSSEPPAHRECATYSVLVCPFLSRPGMRRRSFDIDGTIPAAGAPLTRNPGVSLVWVTRRFKAFRPELGNDGLLYELGEPSETLWWRESRAATRAEVLEALAGGLPTLLEVCERDEDPAASRANVAGRYELALGLVPA
jgi:hypothetical protein